MKYAIFSDDFLSYFRLDDNGETLVLTDRRGYTRAVKLLPYEERPQGKWVFNRYDRVGNWHCSECRHIVIGANNQKPVDNFCPNCGADMRKGGNE